MSSRYKINRHKGATLKPSIIFLDSIYLPIRRSKNIPPTLKSNISLTTGIKYSIVTLSIILAIWSIPYSSNLLVISPSLSYDKKLAILEKENKFISFFHLPSDCREYLIKGYLYRMDHRYTDASKEFYKVLRKKPNNLRAIQAMTSLLAEACVEQQILCKKAEEYSIYGHYIITEKNSSYR